MGPFTSDVRPSRPADPYGHARGASTTVPSKAQARGPAACRHGAGRTCGSPGTERHQGTPAAFEAVRVDRPRRREERMRFITRRARGDCGLKGARLTGGCGGRIGSAVGPTPVT